MVKDFFTAKREWSKYKDMILGYYLTPYLPKVFRIGKPVVIVDCFAGKGRFDDGTDGSPRIIAKAIEKWASKGRSVQALFVEEKKRLFRQLEENVHEFGDLCQLLPGSFEDSVTEIEKLARSHTVFVYIDPYGLKPLKFSLLISIYRHLKTGTSVEVLMNFNSPSLVRNGRAALGLTQKDVPEDEWFLDSEEEATRTMSPEEIDEIAGGQYWRSIVSSEMAFPEMEEACVHEYMGQMGKYFEGVFNYHIKEKYTHNLPKYRLIFGSRHPDAMLLINDAVCNARDRFLIKERVDGWLFDLRQNDEKHDPTRLQEAIHTVLSRFEKLKRRDLIVRSLRYVFGEYKESEHKAAITALLKEGIIYSESGKTRINDDVWLSSRPFRRGV
jgi:three-Cys-motif partner protein